MKQGGVLVHAGRREEEGCYSEGGKEEGKLRRKRKGI